MKSKEPYHGLSDGWQPRTQVAAALTRIDSHDPQTKSFTIERFAGSGFASSVYKATDESGQEVALKVYRTKGARRMFGDALHTLAWGLPFPMRFLESAVLVSEGWHDILKRAAETEGMEDVILPKSSGHFFSSELGSFVGVYEWIDGEQEKAPIIGTEGLLNYQRKRAAFGKFSSLAERVGAGDRVRQWNWWTLVAPLNGLTVRGEKKVAMIDDQPGLPLVGIPFSPGDVATVLKTLASGRLTYFDQPDFQRLDGYIRDHPADFADLLETVAKLKEADKEYRDSLPAPFTRFWFRYFDPQKRRKMREATANMLVANKHLNEKEAVKVKSSNVRAITQLVVYDTPLIGSFLHKMLFSQDYQRHLGNMLGNSEYRYLTNLRQVFKWLDEGRITQDRAEALKNSDLKILLERPLSCLPRGGHRFMVDQDYRSEWSRRLVRALAGRSSFLLRFPFDENLRKDWLIGNVQKEEEAGNLAPQIAEKLYAQSKGAKADQLIKDVLISTVAFNIISWPITIGLAGLGSVIGYEPLTFYSFAQQTPLLPKLFSVVGILRGGYLTVRAVQDHINGEKDGIHLISKKTEAGNILLALTSPFGNVAAPLRMVAEMPELSGFLAGHFLDQMVSKIPIFGQKGTVLEALVYEWFFNRWAKRNVDSQNNSEPSLVQRL